MLFDRVLFDQKWLLQFIFSAVIAFCGLFLLIKTVPSEADQNLEAWAEEEGGSHGGRHGGCSSCGNSICYCSSTCADIGNGNQFTNECVEREMGTDHPKDTYCTVDDWLDLSMEEFSLLLGYPPEGTTNEHLIESREILQKNVRKQTPQVNEIKWEFIWKLKLPATLISFLRSLCMNALSVGEEDIKSYPKTHGRCPFGCPVKEDVDHIFMRCSLSRAVWFGSTLKLKVEKVSPSSIQLWILSILVRSQQDYTGKVKAFLEWITCVCWCIYEHRREVIFHHEKPSPVKVLHHLSALRKEVNNILHKPAQSQGSHEQTDSEMEKYLEEKRSKSNRGLDTFTKASDKRQIRGKARDAKRIQQEEIIQILKDKWIKTNRELKEEQQLVQLLKQECEQIRQSAMRQIEEKELQLADASMAAAVAESRAIAAEEKLFDCEKEIKSSEDKVCVICLNNERDMAFGCGHTTCGDCGSAISICPICRKPITSRLRLFLG
ncbi:uncharacterized protein LOC114730445 [Neltuma alba]|uniref:uncharacterized protein LOC114730445 n=1 Tax=Neltuma alba TaxID=207710 RepID=UPI0010A3623A|nr:uncharacterized protein LOC114730445 [Prosopis alba]